MLRPKLLVSTVGLIAGALVTGIAAFSGPRPCLVVGDHMLEIASAPWHADLHVSFTDDPSLATIRVATTDNAAEADFAVVDDVDGEDDNACNVASVTQRVAVSRQPTTATPVIYMSQDGPADYRIFVKSRRFTLREAAALIVGVRSERPHLAAAL
jgi:hypothetical protein